eukprot:270374-Prymnesium_polylepis.2
MRRSTKRRRRRSNDGKTWRRRVPGARVHAPRRGKSAPAHARTAAPDVCRQRRLLNLPSHHHLSLPLLALAHAICAAFCREEAVGEDRGDRG